MKKRVIVIGAGPGGMAAAMLLASSGYEVHVYEKQPYIGGRNSSLELGEFTFDLGPTFLSMPQFVEELFSFAKRNVKDYLDLKEIEPMYELIFGETSMMMSRDRDVMVRTLDEVAKGGGEGYRRFMEATAKKWERLVPILQGRMDKLTDYLRPSVLKALPELSLTKSLYEVLSEFFDDERLKLAFTFQSKYLGMSPWECPGAFSILSYMEHEFGIYHPIGGVNQLPKAMAKVVEEYNGEIHLGQGVKKLWIEGRAVKGIMLENGEKVAADEVVVNGDFAHVMTNLVDDGAIKKYAKKKLEKKKYSCSTFMIYLGLNKKFDLPHHTIVFSDDYKKNVEEITKTLTMPDNPSIYLQNASVTDPTLAPEGKSTLYILAPVPNNFSEIDWENHKEAFRDLVLKTIEEKTEFKGLAEAIEVEKIITPKDWEDEILVYKGATFNLGHQLSQMMYFRPHNKFEELDNCWLVGGGTHPGSGLPTILESARITARWMMEQDGLTEVPLSGQVGMETVV